MTVDSSRGEVSKDLRDDQQLAERQGWLKFLPMPGSRLRAKRRLVGFEASRGRRGLRRG
ncbi:MAG: hypothetical protein K2W82_16985 [Candidatus Obscuribacterales bacterium]|nr:hypothetical protein [Candidatus Obscuribacterales bacterium]